MAKPTDNLSLNNGRKPVKGTVGDDIIHGTDGRDHIIGYEGNDQLYGHGGDDILEGGAGFNELDGGSGNDTLIGGNDGNTFRVDELNIGDSIIGGAGHDNLYASGTDGSDHLIITGHEGTLFANGVSKVVFEEIDTLAFNGGAGDDVLDASAATMVGWLEVRLNGGAGNDTLIGSPTSTVLDLSELNIGDHVYGGAAWDMLRVFPTGSVTNGDDILTITGQQGTLYSNGSSDVVFDGIESFMWFIHPADTGDRLVDASASTLEYLYLYGGGGDDTFISRQEAPQAGQLYNIDLQGGLGADTLIGGNGVDHLSGGPGADWVEGRLGADWLYGGPGDDVLHAGVSYSPDNDPDTFVFDPGSGHDEVYGFVAGDSASDVIALQGFWFDTLNQLVLTDDGLGNTLIQLNESDTILLHDVTAAALNAGDFLFM